MTLRLLEQLVARLKALVDVVPAGADLVTLTGAQTLQDKTLTAPIVTAPAITGATTIGNGATITTPTITPTAWQTFAYSGTWSAFTSGGTYPTAGYRKGPDGRVYFRGYAQGAGGDLVGSTIATLPVGFRPVGQQHFVTFDGDGKVIQMRVNSNGTIGAVNSATETLSSKFFNFDGISFDSF